MVKERKAPRVNSKDNCRKAVAALSLFFHQLYRKVLAVELQIGMNTNVRISGLKKSLSLCPWHLKTKRFIVPFNLDKLLLLMLQCFHAERHNYYEGGRAIAAQHVRSMSRFNGLNSKLWRLLRILRRTFYEDDKINFSYAVALSANIK